MKLTKIALGLTAAALMAAPAMAQDSEVYAGVGVDTLEFDVYTLSGRLGATFGDFFGVEGQAGFGIIDEEETFGTVETSIGVDFFGAAFLTARFPASEQFDLVGRAGYYFAEVSGDVNGSEVASEDGDGLAIGAGGQFNFGQNYNNGIRLEYTYLDGDGGNGDLVSLAFIRKF